VATPYGELLRQAIRDSGVSRRRLSFLLADRLGNKQSSEYRALGKYQRGDGTPGPEKARVIAELLQRPEVGVVTTKNRRDRLADLEHRLEELEERVAARQREADVFAGELLARLDALEGVQATAEQRSSQQESEQGG
jgi:hypothetical protein